MCKIKQDRNGYLVSIIIPVYNGANYMREAIDSAINQTYKNIEVIVINDGSNDDGKTEEIARSYGDKIRYYYKENGGVSSALNLGISHMRGDYFSWLSHDDVYTLTKIEDQIDILREYNDPNLLCYCKSTQINKDSKPIKSVLKTNRLPTNKICDGKEVLVDMLKYGIYNGCAFLIPSKVFVIDGLRFDENLRYSQDALMWFQIFLNQYRLVCINGEDVMGRVHDKQLTQTGKSFFKKDSLSITELILDKFIVCSDKKYNVIYYYARHNAIYGNNQVVNIVLQRTKKIKALSFGQLVKIKLCLAYGKIRPIIRKAYYSIFRKVKTT